MEEVYLILYIILVYIFQTIKMSDNKALLFTQDEIRALQESWHVLWADKTNNGIKILIK